MFALHFDTNSAAFADGEMRYEAARILRDIASKVADGATFGVVFDYNGNRVGSFELIAKDAEDRR